MDFGIPLGDGAPGGSGRPTCWERPTTLRVAFRGAAGIGLVAVLLGTPGHVHGQGQGSSLRVVGSARLALDPVCNARTGANVEVALRNDGAKPVKLALGSGELISKPPGKTITPVITFTPLDASRSPAPERTTLAPEEYLKLRIGLTGVVDEGEWTLELQNAGAPFGALTVVSAPVPFTVKLDVATPDSLELSFERRKPSRIPLKNDDSVAYIVRGEYSVKGSVMYSRDATLPAKGGAEIPLAPLDDWFDRSLSRLFKDETADGRLTVRSRSPACLADDATPVRVFKVKTTLFPWSAPFKDLWGNALLLGVLLLGALCSVALNFAVPIQSRRLRMRTDLALAARRIDDLPVNVDSRLRTSVEVEQRRLAERLRNLKWYDTQFSTEMPEIDRGLKRLRTRLDLLDQMDLASNLYWRRRKDSLPLSISEEIEELRRQLQDILKRSDPADADIQAAQDLIKKLRDRLVTADAKNQELAERVIKQIEDLKREFQKALEPTSAIGKQIRAALPEPFQVLDTDWWKDPAKLTPRDYYVLERSHFILRQVCDFIDLCGEASGTLDQQRVDAQKEFVRYLRAGSWDDLRRAERLIRKLRQGIFYERVDKEIDGERVDIETSRSPVRQGEPTELRLVFRDKEVNAAAAREEYTYEWVFEPDGQKKKGWSVLHYFPEATAPEPRSAPVSPLVKVLPLLKRVWPSRVLPGPDEKHVRPNVTVNFIRDDGKTVAGTVRKAIPVLPPLRLKRASLWMELGRLGLALGIATAGLIAGGREQILKLDLFPALIAVFLLGFGSDRIKNVFAQRPLAPPDEPKPAAGG